MRRFSRWRRSQPRSCAPSSRRAASTTSGQPRRTVRLDRARAPPTAGWITLVVHSWEHGLAECGYSLSRPSRAAADAARAHPPIGDLFARTRLHRLEAHGARQRGRRRRCSSGWGFAARTAARLLPARRRVGGQLSLRADQGGVAAAGRRRGAGALDGRRLVRKGRRRYREADGRGPPDPSGARRVPAARPAATTSCCPRSPPTWRSPGRRRRGRQRSLRARRVRAPLGDLRYETGDSAQRQQMLHETGAEIGRMLGAVPGLAGALRVDPNQPGTLIHLRLTLSASELALLPFEIAKAPISPTVTADSWLSIQTRPPVCVTRNVRTVSPEGVVWPLRPHILFIVGDPQTVPYEEHRAVLVQAIAPFLYPHDGGYEPPASTAPRQQFDDLLTILLYPTLSEVLDEARQVPYTHVHVLTHGDLSDTSRDSYGLVLRGQHGESEVVSGEQLASALTSVGKGRIHRPTVITVASCDSGNVGTVVIPGASFAHALHQAGVPLVVASQFPLSKVGSVPLARTLYNGFLWGDNPRPAAAAALRAARAVHLYVPRLVQPGGVRGAAAGALAATGGLALLPGQAGNQRRAGAHRPRRAAGRRAAAARIARGARPGRPASDGAVAAGRPVRRRMRRHSRQLAQAPGAGGLHSQPAGVAGELAPLGPLRSARGGLARLHPGGARAAGQRHRRDAGGGHPALDAGPGRVAVAGAGETTRRGALARRQALRRPVLRPPFGGAARLGARQPRGALVVEAGRARPVASSPKEISERALAHVQEVCRIYPSGDDFPVKSTRRQFQRYVDWWAPGIRE